MIAVPATLEDQHVPKMVGPAIPRWQLGEALTQLRKNAGFTEAQVAEQLGCSESKIRKIESGYVSVNRAELLLMLKIYEADDELGEPLLDLQAQGKQRGWWRPYGQLSPRFAQFLSLESSATKIRTFELGLVPGLLQTEEYARAIVSSHTPGLSPEQVDRQVKIKLERQQRVLEEPPDLWVILDEAALHRPAGAATVMIEQLKHLARVARTRQPGGINLHVIPYGHGSYPGQLGSFVIFEYDEQVHSPVVYVEGQAGSVFMHDEADLARCSLWYEQMTAAALSGPKSAQLIDTVAKQFEETKE